jgi:hypothetical protein
MRGLQAQLLPGGRVHDETVLDLRERRELVVGQRAVRPDVMDAPAPDKQRIRDQAAVASPPERLGAHDRGLPFARHALELGDGGREIGGLHVVGVPAKACVSPAAVRGVAGRPPPAAELLHVQVADALGRERGLEALAGEVWKTPRAGNDPDIDQLLDFVPAQKRDEVRQRMGRMADGVEAPFDGKETR